MSSDLRPDSGGYENVKEAWALYDTIMIAGWAGVAKVPGWFDSYINFAQKQTHSFFNMRNQGEAGLAYNNQETKDQMPYVFHLYSIGVSFSAPLARPADNKGTTEIPPDHNAACDAIFAKDIPTHIGLKLRVRQDDKLLHTCYLAPEGAGFYGNVAGIGDMGGTPPAAANTASLTSGTQGQPILDNRWKFPSPIAIPRGATFHAELELSEYARQLLGMMPGPEAYQFNTGADPDSTRIGAASTIRCSMIGKREVQQRGQLHY